MDNDDRLSVSEQISDAFVPVLAALRAGAARLAAIPGLVTARPGFKYDGPRPAPAVVVAVRPPASEEARAKLEQELSAALGVPASVLEAHPQEQLAQLAPAAFAAPGPSDLEKLLLSPEVPDFRPPLVGSYRPPEGAGAPNLDAVDDEMKLTICVSPEGGWSVLRNFFATPAKERCTVAMYQFSAPHILEALSGAVKGKDVKVLMTLHPHGEPVARGGTKAHDLSRAQVLERLGELGSRFQHALTSIGASGVFASAYHIKVAVVDGKRMWLSSGNWQSSNQPPCDPFAAPNELLPGFPRSYNRDYHVVIEHEGLARTYERFIEYDFEIARAEPPAFAPPPDLFVPEDEELPPDFAPPRYFAPKTLQRRIKVQPILTPDNYAPKVLELVRSARRTLYLQNQYINLNADGDLPGFQKLVKALLDKQTKGVDVRVICRNLMKPEKVDMLVALGFDIDRIKLMPACHTKTIIVDSERVVLGSHNWSNEGTVSNRDASLIFDDAEIAAYYQEIFLYDWGRLKSVKPHQLPQPRVAGEGEPTPPGMVRVSWAEVFDD